MAGCQDFVRIKFGFMKTSALSREFRIFFENAYDEPACADAIPLCGETGLFRSFPM